MTYRELLREALALPQEKRLRLLEKLNESLDAETPLSEEWMAEIQRRSDELESGKVKGIPWEEVKRKKRSRRIRGHGRPSTDTTAVAS
jgi:putative addiction module component (TIGR02574 family)